MKKQIKLGRNHCYVCGLDKVKSPTPEHCDDWGHNIIWKKRKKTADE